MAAPRYDFASDNTSGLCPEAWAALAEANVGRTPSYGEDRWTEDARALIRQTFETDCDVFFVFNGTAANALALAACCRAPFTRILCHELSHVDTDECGAPEFFTGGAKVIPLPGSNARLDPLEIERALHRGHGVHYPKPAALSLTQSTELGTLYTPAEIAALASLAHHHGLAVHMDGARFANAVAAFQLRGPVTPADLTWRAGVDVLCFGGTKNGMNTTEAVVFFNRELAHDFAYRVKQSGQLASKMRFGAAQWTGLLRDGAWLRHATHANAQAARLSQGLRDLPSLRLVAEPEVNGVFIEMPDTLYDALTARGWQFHRFVGAHGFRLMCSWSTTDVEIDAFVADVKSILEKK